MWISIAAQKGKRDFFLIKLILKYDEINGCLYVNSVTMQRFKCSQVIVKDVKNIEDVKNVTCNKLQRSDPTTAVLALRNLEI